MNIILWILQVLLAVHTFMGAVWKFSHSAEQTMPSLAAIPSGVWLAMSVLEILASAALILPALARRRPPRPLVPIAAAFIAAEMLLFCALHLIAGSPDASPMIYWLIVAALSTFVAYGRADLKTH